MDTLLLSRS